MNILLASSSRNFCGPDDPVIERLKPTNISGNHLEQSLALPLKDGSTMHTLGHERKLNVGGFFQAETRALPFKP